MSWRIVGTNLRPDASELPRRLPPVFQRGDGPLLVSIGGGDDPPGSDDDPSFAALDASDIVGFNSPIEARRRHLVVRTEEDREPALVAREDLDDWLQGLAWDALRSCAEHLAAYRLEAASERAWYAVRASPGSPLPWLTVIAFLRRSHRGDDAALYLDRVSQPVRGLPPEFGRRLQNNIAARRALIELLNGFTPDQFDLLPNEGSPRRDFLCRSRASLRDAHI